MTANGWILWSCFNHRACEDHFIDRRALKHEDVITVLERARESLAGAADSTATQVSDRDGGDYWTNVVVLTGDATGGLIFL